jgi:uncharacterized protein
VKRHALSWIVVITCLSLISLSTGPFVFGQTAGESSPTLLTKRTIQVSGEGEASGKPDKGIITLGVETNARTAAQTMTENSAAMKALLASLKESGIEEKHIQTSAVDLSPQYRAVDAPDVKPELIGFRASNQVRVTVLNLENMGKAIDAAIGAGANRVDSIQFDIRDKKPVLDQARKDAMEDALRKAKLLAAIAGVEVGAPLTISEFTLGPPRPMMDQRMMAFGAAKEEVPIAPGEETLRASVQVTYELIAKADKK